MNWINLDSPSLIRMAYDEEQQVLTVQYTTGKYYEFFKVTPVQFEEMKENKYPGRYLTEQIRSHCRYEHMPYIAVGDL